MSVIKQISVYNGTNWDTKDIGVDASNVALGNSIVLTDILPASKLNGNRVVLTGSDQKLTTSSITDVNLACLSNCTVNIQSQLTSLASSRVHAKDLGTNISNQCVGVTGVITSERKQLYLWIPMNFYAPVSGIVITSLKIRLRLPSGGYLISDGEEIVNEITSQEVKLAQGIINVSCNRGTSGTAWYTTNNVPVTGIVDLIANYI